MSEIIDHPFKWMATVFYRTNAGSNEVVHYLEEIEDLHDFVERGPHWETIEKIEVVFIKDWEGKITVEEAEKL